MDKPPQQPEKDNKEKIGRRSTIEKLPALNLAPAGAEPAKEKGVAAGNEPPGSAAALDRIEKADDGEAGVYQSKKMGSELTSGEKETIIKGRGLILTEDKEGYEFMYDMLTGLRATCSKRDYRSVKISQADFESFHDLRFPSKGSSITPPHMQRDFKFADYAPLVFARIREAFGIDPADYLDSLAKEYNLSCVRSPGKSGSVFYYSNDGRFMIKTITQSECHFLQSILPGYYNHVITHPDTLITRFLGLHRVKPHKDKKAYIVVMSNVLFSAYFDIDELYDLKGSTVGRAATQDASAPKKRGVVYKDLDFTRGFELGPAKSKILMDALRADCKFLESQNIMDYSLLLGVHTLTQADLKFDPRRPDLPPTPRSSIRQRPTISYRSIFSHDWGGLRSTDAENNGTSVIYFIGVIDILQEYNVRKKLEHGFKSLKYESDKISAVNALVYAQRFLNYMKIQIRTIPAKPMPPASPVRAPAPSLSAFSAPQRPVSKLGVEIESAPKPSGSLIPPPASPPGEVGKSKERKEKKKRTTAEEANGNGNGNGIRPSASRDDSTPASSDPDLTREDGAAAKQKKEKKRGTVTEIENGVRPSGSRDDKSPTNERDREDGAAGKEKREKKRREKHGGGPEPEPSKAAAEAT